MLYWDHSLCLSVQLSALYHVASSGRHPPIPEHLSDNCKAFLGRCFVMNPDHRASAADLLADPWLARAKRSSARYDTVCMCFRCAIAAVKLAVFFLLLCTIMWYGVACRGRMWLSTDCTMGCSSCRVNLQRHGRAVPGSRSTGSTAVTLIAPVAQQLPQRSCMYIYPSRLYHCECVSVPCVAAVPS